MPDICACINKECKNKDLCYRYSIKLKPLQTYSEFKSDKNGYCHYFIMKNKTSCK